MSKNRVWQPLYFELHYHYTRTAGIYPHLWHDARLHFTLTLSCSRDILSEHLASQSLMTSHPQS